MFFYRKTFFICLIFFVTGLNAQDYNLVKLNKDSLLVDFEVLKTAILDNHPVMYTYISRDSFCRIADNAAGRVAQGQTLPEFYESISMLTASVGCGHTFAIPAGPLDKRGRLPFSVVITGTGVYISQQLPAADSILGYKVTQVNHLPCDEALKKIYPLISSDGYNNSYKNFIAGLYFDFWLQVLFNSPSSMVFELEGAQGEKKQVEVLAQNVHVSDANDEEEEDDETTLTYPFAGKSIALLTVPGFDGGKDDIRKAFRKIKKKHIKTLIIDLRNNGGGNGNISEFLLAHILDSAFTVTLEKRTNPFVYKKYFGHKQGLIAASGFRQKDSITKSLSISKKPRKRNHFEGDVILLINGKTFSAAADAASLLKHKGNALVIGSETGGGESALGGGVIAMLNLPYTKLAIKFPLYRIVFGGAPVNSRNGVLPHIEVNYTIDDIMHNTDLEMKKIEELIADNKIKY